MSAPMRLTAYDITKLGEFLMSISRATKHTDVVLGAYGNATVQVADVAIEIRWNAATGQYETDEWIGS